MSPESAPETDHDPLVSVVVCFYNNVDLTRRCLEHIGRNTRPVAYEIILVDDGSDEEGAAEFASFPHVRYLRMDNNCGFTAASNLGAEQARGKYLVFLNNDTEVQTGWLESLLDAATDGPDIGAVGAQLVYPDGRLQEAGGVIWSDATGLNFGWGDDPADPAYTYRREVDYCSGACLLVPRDFFEATGGFDRSFAPGYYEDTDLCFRVRQAGKVVLYDPGARVVHHEGATFGNESHAGLPDAHDKSAQYTNRYRFQAKWANELLHHFPAGTAGGWRGGRFPDRPRVLVCDQTLCAPDKDSGSLRIAWIVRLLHEIGCEVTFFPFDRLDRQPYADWLRRLGVEVHCGPKGLDELGQERPDLYDLVFLARPSVASGLREPARRWFPRAVFVYDTVDLHFVREGRALELRPPTPRERHALRKTQRTELDEIRAADIVAAVTEVERAMIEELAPEATTFLLPNVHEVRDGAVPGKAGRAGCLFIGSYDHAPNVDAIEWFLSDVSPLLPAGPDAMLTAVGERSPGVLENLPEKSVDFRGHILDVMPLFDQSRVFVAPLRFGAGMKGKIGMALTFGLPVVTTSIGAEGMGLVHGVHAFIADGAQELASAIALLQKDDELWSTLSANGQALAAERWSPSAMQERLTALLRTAVPDNRMFARSWGLASPAKPFGPETPTLTRHH